jgi:phosphonate transport system permease protein
MRASRRWLIVVLLGVLAAAIWSAGALHITIATFVDGWDNAVDFLDRTVPFTLPEPAELWRMIGQTLAIVVLATVLGFLISLPMALLAAANTTPHPAVRMVARLLIVLERALPDFILAIFFVRVFGIGSLPGILALGIGSVGMMAKLYADAIEEVDRGPQEALRAAGASKLQQVFGGVLPQVKPQLIATALHAFDINLRSSVILGFVGVSGIGMYISAALETLNYGRGLGLTMVLLALCLLAELVSNVVRRSMLGHHAPKGSRSFAALLPRLTERGWVRGRTPGTAAARRPPSRPAAPRSAAAPVERLTPPWNGTRIRSTAGRTALVVAVLVSLVFSGADGSKLFAGLGRGLQTLGLYFPPETQGILDKLLAAMVETVQMGLAGTLVGLVIAVPFGLLSASNVAPNATVAGIARILVVSIRAVPGIIIGILFVVITGLGPTAGALALAIGSIGFFGKVIADSLEEVDVRVQDAVRTSGAGSGQVFFAATLRQVAPALAAHVMHQLDSSIRGAAGMGVIGAGGIGFYMTNASRVLEYGVVSTCLVLLVLTVLLSEALAMWTRREVQ